MKTKTLRRYLIAGLLVWLPVWATLLVIGFIVRLLDKTMALIPAAYRPEALLGFYIPGFGVILSLILLLATGVLATNFLGEKLVLWGEGLLARIPLVRSIYHAVKQVVQTIFSSNSQAFRKVLLVEYPRKGLWSIAFQTATTSTKVDSYTEDHMLTIFLPTTPNPTSGFLMLIPKKDVIELDMSIDEALTMVISLGVMQPEFNQAATPKENEC